jgi:hypothetical protein
MTTADGVILPLIAAIAAALVLSRGVAESRTRSLQASLAGAGVAAVLIWISALGAADRIVGSWAALGYKSQIGPGIWVSGVGAALLAAAGTILSVRAWRRNGAGTDPSDVVIISRRTIAQAVSEVLGGVIGLIGGIALALNTGGPQNLGLIAFAAIFGGAAGLYAGDRLARLV